MPLFPELLATGNFMPHGFCYLWNMPLVWLHVVSDSLIALSYYAIPFILVWFVRKRRDLPFSWMFVLFGIFIIACGTTHLMEIWNLWHADYWVSGAIKAITAAASLPTAVLLARLMPQAVALPNLTQWAAANAQLTSVNEELAAANRALRQSEERYRLLFDSNPHPVWVYDLKTLDFLDVNHSAVRNYGYSREEFLALTIKDIRPAEDVPALLQNVARTPARSEASGTWRHRKKSGTLIDVELTSHPLVFDGKDARIVVATDITMRKKAQDLLRASEERFRNLLESAPDAMVIANSKGCIQLVNAQAEKLFGYSRSEMIGQPVEILVPSRFKDQRTGDRGRYSKSPHTRGMGVGLELFAVRKDGSEFPVEISLSPLDTDHGTLISSAIRDVSERRRAQDAIQNLNRELQRRVAEISAANEELESFSYSVSHDLRAPLRHIDGFARILKEEYASHLPQDGVQYLDRVLKAAHQMGALVDDLLNLARIGRKEMARQKVNLGALVRETIGELASQLKDRDIEWKIAPLSDVECDPGLVKLALMNLLSNALKFTRTRSHAVIEIGATQAINGAHAFFVRDNGVGFDAQYADKLFGVFQRLHRLDEFEGTGVGLVTVRRIIRRHGGDIWAESQLGQGATFSFTFEPAHEPAVVY